MSALQLHKIKSVANADICLEEGCNRSGRYELFLLGHPSRSSYIGFRRSDRLCQKHAKEWEETFNELTGASELQQVEAAVLRLKEPVPARTEAVFELRAFGFSKTDIARAMQGVGEGLGAEEVLERVFGDEREAVAA